MNNPTPYTAHVERVFMTRAGRFVSVRCPFLCQQVTHVHPWRRGQRTPSREVLAPCAGIGELATYAIDPASADVAQATAGQKAAGGRRS